MSSRLWSTFRLLVCVYLFWFSPRRLRIRRYCLVGICIMFFGVFYWAVWRIMLPKLGKYRLIPEKEILKDGTVVTIVGSLITYRRYLRLMISFQFTHEELD
ncbi:hypothetical protein L208DRAFT_127989 [Tricholoma matsutake]|nr:hypothetical protein L208DRAFT_127989 [Tricholoma matsutake 945]